MKPSLFAIAFTFAALPALAQTTIQPNTSTLLPRGSVTVNPSGQDAFIVGATDQTQNVTQAPTATANPTATAGGGRSVATVTNNISGNGLPGGASGYPSTIRNTPSSTLALATAYCQNNAGVSGSGPGFSFGIAGGKHDVDCIRQNYAMLLTSMGMTQEALLVVANNKEVNEAIWEAHRQREANKPAAGPIQPAGMNRATVRDPRPSARDCENIRTMRDPQQANRDYFAANCQ